MAYFGNYGIITTTVYLRFVLCLLEYFLLFYNENHVPLAMLYQSVIFSDMQYRKLSGCSFAEEVFSEITEGISSRYYTRRRGRVARPAYTAQDETY